MQIFHDIVRLVIVQLVIVQYRTGFTNLVADVAPSAQICHMFSVVYDIHLLKI